ncbi:MAG: aminodeoxychorismate synthase component I, partial [Actinomycetota bacterium]|nr:aminodeoxychorismate synthase component I [Actinomycetota bacterium]
LSTISHRGTGLFAGLPQGFTAVRYHSLCLPLPVPAPLVVDAWSEDGVVMAVHHRARPWWGVQFHPESVASQQGADLLANFRSLILGSWHAPTSSPPSRVGRNPRRAPARAAATWLLRTRLLPYEVDAEMAFEQLCADRPYAFWLDSCPPGGELSRFSFVGHPDAPGGEVLSYDASEDTVAVLDGCGRAHGSAPGGITEVLQQRLAERQVPADPQLPFGLAGGYVGYLGYEIKADLGSPNEYAATTPDAVWVFAARFIAVDHVSKQTWLVATCRSDPDETAAAQQWLAHTSDRLPPAAGVQPAEAPASTTVDPVGLLHHQPERYVENVTAAQAQLRAGESYEVCLTNEAVAPFRGDALTVYRRQRRGNPAPYSAFLRLGRTQVLCSSPERFVHVDRTGVIESRPIKGTAPHGPTAATDVALRHQLASSAKTRAENLMIVDLIRNDLGRVCEVGSVHVPSFMTVQSYATVHQLVSTVRGQLRTDVDAVTAVRSCFPGGSMTGAPKLRTMEIIESLEGRARGVYSGAIGYFGLAGTADLNIVIRTAIVSDGVLRVGAGGAIVLDSDPDDEYEEMLLKMRAGLSGVRGDDLGPSSITAHPE